MIPLRDVNPSRLTPVVNYAIIVICTLAFIYQIRLGPQLEAFVHEYGVVPSHYTDPERSGQFGWMELFIPLFTSLFLHGGWLHLIGNMWVLYIFGDNIESVLGHVRYIFFYILSGLVATLIHLFTNPASQLPTIGASGAIAGVMGAYFILYPRAKVITLVPIFFFITIIHLPAYIFLGLWFLLQFYQGAFSLVQDRADMAGIAWWAHVGGFLGGLILLLLFKGVGTIKEERSKEIS